MRLKSGEYDGTHIMKAWITIQEQENIIAELQKANNNFSESFKRHEIRINEMLEMSNHFKNLSDSRLKKIAELEEQRKDLIEEFAEAECMGDLAKIARNYGYIEGGDV